MMDADTVSETNCIRQPFSISDIGQNKATVLVNRINLFWGTNWRAEPRNFDERTFERIQDTSIDFLIGCVDSRAARSIIARSLVQIKQPPPIGSISATTRRAASSFLASRGTRATGVRRKGCAR
jgi:tRNA A37 threonylcarbamoyladenosine dehydratase